MNRRCSPSLWLALALWVPGAALALAPPPSSADAGSLPALPDIATIDLESLLDLDVEAVARREEKSSRAAASVFVLTAEDVRRHGFRTLAELLRSVPGLSSSSDGVYQYAAVRGVGLPGDFTTRLLVLIDGHPLNNKVSTGQSYLGRDLPISLAALKRVEVIKGPVGAVYGPTAYFGVINLVTWAAERGGGEVALSGDLLQAGPHGGGELSAFVAREVGPVEVTAEARVYQDTGSQQDYPELELTQDRPLPATGARVSGLDAEHAKSAYLKLHFRGLGGNFGCGDFTKRLASAPYSTIIGDPRGLITNRTCFAQLGYTAKPSERLEVYGRVAYDDFLYQDELPYPDPPDDFGMFRDVGIDRWFSGEARLTWRPFDATTLTLGAEGQAHLAYQHSRYLALPSAIEDPEHGFGVGPIVTPFRTLNTYVMVDQELPFGLRAQGGLTFYVHELFGLRLTPKAALLWQATADDNFKAVYSEGFRPPTIFEAFFDDGLDLLPNPAVRPERVASAELVYERRLGPGASLSLSLFHNEYFETIRYETVPAPGLGHLPNPLEPTDFRQQARNGPAFALDGADAAVRLRSRWVQGWGGLSVQRLTGGDRANFEAFTGSVNVSAQPGYQPLSLAVHAAFGAPREKVADSTLPGQPTSVPAFFVLSASATLEIRAVPGLSVDLAVHNLLDAAVYDPVPGDYAPISAVREPGRSVRATVRYGF